MYRIGFMKILMSISRPLILINEKINFQAGSPDEY
jgi:hypothetical protein